MKIGLSTRLQPALAIAHVILSKLVRDIAIKQKVAINLVMKAGITLNVMHLKLKALVRKEQHGIDIRPTLLMVIVRLKPVKTQIALVRLHRVSTWVGVTS